MPTTTSVSKVSRQAARALSGGIVVEPCPIWTPLHGRQRVCSGKCRAALSRKVRAEKQRRKRCGFGNYWRKPSSYSRKVLDVLLRCR
jgi:hypothetical protein